MNEKRPQLVPARCHPIRNKSPTCSPPAIGRGESMMSGRENDRHLRGDWPHFRSFAKQPIITRRANNNKTRNKNDIHGGQLSPLQKDGHWEGGSGDDSLKSYTRETIDSTIGKKFSSGPIVKIFVIYTS